MAGSASNYAENKIIDHLTGKTSFAMPSVWVGLSTTAMSTDAGTFTEVSGGSYARKSTAGADWNAASSGSATNANAITFTTATGNWGTIQSAALFDASSAGNMLLWADLTASKTVNNGDTFSFAASNFTITLD
jgi:hypothetical protein